MVKNTENPRKSKRIRWQEICPTCLKYDYPNHPPECKYCKENGITEGILCDLTRMDQEDDPNDFQCGAYQPKNSLHCPP